MSRDINPCRCGADKAMSIKDLPEHVEIYCENCGQIQAVKYGRQVYATKAQAEDAAVYSWNKRNPIK